MTNSEENNQRPFIVECNQLEVGAPLVWLSKGWSDFKAAPKHSLAYGGVIFVLSWIITLSAWSYHSITLAIILISGFIFIAPVMSIGLYSISRQIKRGHKPELKLSFTHGFSAYSDILIYAGVLMVIFLVWVRAASMIHVFFPTNANPEIGDLILFLGIGSAVGQCTYRIYRISNCNAVIRLCQLACLSRYHE